MVNLDKQEILDFLKSGAILGSGDGVYYLQRSVRLPTTELEPRFWYQSFHGEPQTKAGSYLGEVASLDLLDIFEEFQNEPLPTIATVSQTSEQLFKSFFDIGMTTIRSGEIQKIVPYASKSFSQTMTSMDVLSAIVNLIKFSEKNNSYLFGAWDKGEGFVGSTPELLVKKERNFFSTMALAGTRPTDQNPELLLTDQKEIHEHELVVEGIVQSLKSLGEVRVGERRIKRLSRVSHLETPISLLAFDEGLKISDVAACLHPTPALGGMPRLKAEPILREFDKLLPRKNFGGPFGVDFPNGDGLAVVMIRGVSWDLKNTDIFAGCGVVEGSEFSREWLEVQSKMSAIEGALGWQI